VGPPRVVSRTAIPSPGSALIQAGVSLAYVQNQMGHRSIQVTIDVYGHLIPGENVAWIDNLDSTPRKVMATDAHAEQASRGRFSDGLQAVEAEAVIGCPPGIRTPIC
jgi:hypothetical protein